MSELGILELLSVDATSDVLKEYAAIMSKLVEWELIERKAGEWVVTDRGRALLEEVEVAN